MPTAGITHDSALCHRNGAVRQLVSANVHSSVAPDAHARPASDPTGHGFEVSHSIPNKSAGKTQADGGAAEEDKALIRMVVRNFSSSGHATHDPQPHSSLPDAPDACPAVHRKKGWLATHEAMPDPDIIQPLKTSSSQQSADGSGPTFAQPLIPRHSAHHLELSMHSSKATSEGSKAGSGWEGRPHRLEDIDDQEDIEDHGMAQYIDLSIIGSDAGMVELEAAAMRRQTSTNMAEERRTTSWLAIHEAVPGMHILRSTAGSGRLTCDLPTIQSPQGSGKLQYSSLHQHPSAVSPGQHRNPVYAFVAGIAADNHMTISQAHPIVRQTNTAMMSRGSINSPESTVQAPTVFRQSQPGRSSWEWHGSNSGNCTNNIQATVGWAAAKGGATTSPKSTSQGQVPMPKDEKGFSQLLQGAQPSTRLPSSKQEPTRAIAVHHSLHGDSTPSAAPFQTSPRQPPQARCTSAVGPNSWENADWPHTNSPNTSRRVLRYTASVQPQQPAIIPAEAAYTIRVLPKATSNVSSSERLSGTSLSPSSIKLIYPGQPQVSDVLKQSSLSSPSSSKIKAGVSSGLHQPTDTQATQPQTSQRWQCSSGDKSRAGKAALPALDM